MLKCFNVHQRAQKRNTFNSVSTNNYSPTISCIVRFPFTCQFLPLQWPLPIWHNKHDSHQCSKAFAAPPCSPFTCVKTIECELKFCSLARSTKTWHRNFTCKTLRTKVFPFAVNVFFLSLSMICKWVMPSLFPLRQRHTTSTHSISPRESVSLWSQDARSPPTAKVKRKWAWSR